MKNAFLIDAVYRSQSRKMVRNFVLSVFSIFLLLGFAQHQSLAQHLNEVHFETANLTRWADPRER